MHPKTLREVAIVSAARSAIGRAPRGALRYTRPDDLAAAVLNAVIARAEGLLPHEIDDVILGCATPEGEQGFNLARIAALRAGLPERVAGLTVNRFCASGLEAVALAAAKIAAGHADVIAAGGAESMSLQPFMGPSTRPNPYLMMHRPDTYLSMGLSVEGVAHEFGITREMADDAALISHAKAIAAQDCGRFDDEIIAVSIEVEASDGRTIERHEIEFARDEGPRRDTNAEALARLKPAFRSDGILTAGNSSQLSDGAAVLILMSVQEARARGLKQLARFVDYAVAGTAPERFGIAPAYAIPKLLGRTGVSLDEIGLIEFNEAFAAQVLASDKLYPLPTECVNVNGGAVALGHPLGATGARQLVTLIYEGRRRGVKLGMVTMCAALGMGAAGLIELD